MEAQEQAMIVDKPEPTWKIITVATIAAGVQFGWALQLSLLTPYVQTLGVPHAYATFVWLCGPLSGLIVQPVVGYFSDRLTWKFGRRRPYIIGGGLSVAVSVFLIGFAKDLGHWMGDTLEQKTKTRAVGFFVVGFWILDVANNMLQGPTRAFLADLSNGDHKMMRVANAYFSFFMGVGNVLGYAAGSYQKLYKILPFTETVACTDSCANLKTCFIIDIILLVTVVTISSILVSEKQYVRDGTSEERAAPSFVTELFTSFRTMKKPMWILLAVTAINWIAWFPFLIYNTDWMGREVFGGMPTGTPQQTQLYDTGVRAGAFALLINSIVLGLMSLGVEPVGRLVGGPKYLWGIVNMILGGALLSTMWVNRAAESWRDTHGLHHPPTDIQGGAYGIFAILGIPLAITFSLPFAMASIYCSVSGGGQGLSLGVVNLAIVIPQMFVSMAAGPIDNAFGGGNLPAFVMGAIAAVTSALLAVFVLPNASKPKGAAPVVMAGGGH